MRLLILAVPLMWACGTSPEFIDEPEVPVEPVAVDNSPKDTPRNGDQWQCAGSTGMTRLKGRMTRQVGVEGFSSRGCNKTDDATK